MQLYFTLPSNLAVHFAMAAQSSRLVLGMVNVMTIHYCHGIIVMVSLP